ncbi:HAD domain-containing protein [Paraburkholderia dinghuensis]|nr:HAD domain-containing protein [Paraburkholderia dinghuensis]
MRQVLFLDIDGVLHRGNAYRTPGGVVSSAPGQIELFEYAGVLDELLQPYPAVEIVLSTDWALTLGLEYTRASLPLATLRDRVSEATYYGNKFHDAVWPLLPRGAQVLDYVARRSLTSWLAVDDRTDGFEAHRDRLVHCQSEVGLGDPAVVELFRLRLQSVFSQSFTEVAGERTTPSR